MHSAIKAGLTARQASLLSCHVCGLLSRMPKDKPQGEVVCSRCGASLHSRKPNSLARTWALLISAIVFYIPANVMPITLTTTLGREQGDTIMSGVIYFMQEGNWPVALVIFTASIFVPIIKLLILIYLLLSIRSNTKTRLKDRTRLYRLTELIGRWSMVDVYVVTLLVALVHFGILANIKAGPAIVDFAAVVVITMFAAMMLDPRLIWDAKNER